MGLLDFLQIRGKKITIITDGEQETPGIQSGNAGTQILSGMIDEDYNNELQFPQSVETFDKMRKSDGTVSGILKAIKNPITSAEWEIVGGESDKDKEIATFVEKNMFENIDFQQFLKEALGFLDF